MNWLRRWFSRQKSVQRWRPFLCVQCIATEKFFTDHKMAAAENWNKSSSGFPWRYSLPVLTLFAPNVSYSLRWRLFTCFFKIWSPDDPLLQTLNPIRILYQVFQDIQIQRSFMVCQPPPPPNILCDRPRHIFNLVCMHVCMFCIGVPAS
jgi:hypothetical protein